MTDECQSEGCWLARRHLPRSAGNLPPEWLVLLSEARAVCRALDSGCEVHSEVKDAIGRLREATLAAGRLIRNSRGRCR